MESYKLIDSAFFNIDLLDDLYQKFCDSPFDVDPSFHSFFTSFDKQEELNVQHPLEIKKSLSPPDKGLGILKLINTYRSYGHLFAKINPLYPDANAIPRELNLENIGFSTDLLNESFPTCGLLEKAEVQLFEIIDVLKETYCGNIGVEYMGLQNPELEQWLQEQIEPNRFKIKLSIDQKRMILQHLNQSELFENFLHTKYVGQKRFSLEGGETLIPILASVIETGADLGAEEFVLGMAHRGRLNVLSNILNKSYTEIFSEFEDRWIPNSFEGSGDVKYHKGFSSTRKTELGKIVKIDLAPNPSHLEAVNPVVEGEAFAKQVLKGGKSAQKSVVPILIHGDAALAGQGIVYETMQMYDLAGYSTGGTVHVVINNQIGFTTKPKDNRSTRYCTEIARAFNAPVFHVNAEDPEACIYATNLAVAIRQKFHCDVFIDLYCYRKYGHNETDEPAYTQPVEYKTIRQKKGIREIYRDDLIQQGILERHMAEALEAEFKQALQEALQSSRFPEEALTLPPRAKKNVSEHELKMLEPVKTYVDEKVIEAVGKALCSVPEDFCLHKKLIDLNRTRQEMVLGNKEFDWGMGELMSYGTLLFEGFSVRLAGQDCGRGTFSHRHAVFFDQENGKSYVSLQHLSQDQGRFDVINSLLSEYAALGFEFGYSLGNPKSLVLWEAQFGDFANGAQVMIDQFITSCEQKWGLKNKLVMLLPHGYEGQGPEHSSARIERFLTLAGDDNMFIVNPTTPAQFFHVLRRQMHSKIAKPLIVFTPKALLRHPKCVSPLQDFKEGSFEEVIVDPLATSACTKLVFCSGKVYYDLVQEREKLSKNDVAIIRIEQLYPLHKEKVSEVFSHYSECHQIYWVQEEPENMGPWNYMSHELGKVLPNGQTLTYIGRDKSAASATGSVSVHKIERQNILDKLFNHEAIER